MSRSCHSATFSIAAIALARTRRARPTICSQPIGLRLCGIADEPFWPLRERLFDLADLGLLQAADLERELLERGGGDRQRAHQLGVAIALDHLRRHGVGLEAEPLAHRLFDRGIEVGKRADGAGDHPDADALAGAARRARCCAPASAYHSASFRPKVISSAWTPCVRPIIGVWRCSSGARLDRVGERAHVLEDEVAGLDHLQRLRGVDDIGGGQAEVQPARRRPDLLRHRRGEGDDVVLGDSFDFVDAGDVEVGPRAQVARRFSRARCRRRPSLRRRPVPPGARSRTCAARSRCDPSRGWCSVQSSLAAGSPSTSLRAGREPGAGSRAVTTQVGHLSPSSH